ncbi:MAG: WXG100 family type VII secretion target [Kutzneria sp.]|nr:WXG100 family type VII secretion target [Kutzneria sp.]
MAKDIQNVEQEIQGSVSKLMSDIAPLQSSWKGQAATAFHSLMERFNEDARKLNQALNDIATQMKTASGTYAQQEQEQSHSISSVANRLSGGA